ncbi:UBX domain-containing protein 1 [Rhypophila decipiens]|uniref:UBX domain-containing protein 1 n=1 Tax=Rhypophila decipiens TaxID=261697 RepID=A0AAN6Y3T8_9PEZI|nr:UBX domain-containing protein 1 [Rhypophila decipiens]
MASHDDLISAFVDMTMASADKATEYLTASNWDLENAVTSYFADQDEDNEQSPPPSAAAAEPEPEYTGPRTLDGRPAPEYAGAKSSSSKKPAKRTGLATLSSLGGGHSHDDDDDDDDDDDEDERRGPRDLFAGGEKSGLAVQDPSQRSNDPRKLVNDIVAKAKENSKSARQPEESPASRARSSFFRGGGQTLGGDGVESTPVPAPRGSGSAREDGPAQERFLHIWEDGFSIDDGELRRFDDPENRAALEMIRQGRAPVHLMNVSYDQRVDVKLLQHNEPYRPQPKIYRPFGGEGRRLGSPVPGEASVAPPPASTSTTTSATSTSQPTAPSTGVNESQPTLMLRIQLPDGTRLPARFNTTQTVGDVYEFIQRASSSISGRSWVLSTTFPNKDHTEKDLVLGELPEFKRGGTAVVKWA